MSVLHQSPIEAILRANVPAYRMPAPTRNPVSERLRRWLLARMMALEPIGDIGDVSLTDNTSTVPDSAVSRWEFEGDATDSWDENDGTLEGTTSFTNTSAVGDQAIDFQTGWMDIGTPANMAFTASDPFTLSLWINADSWTGSDGRIHWFSSRSGDDNNAILWSLASDDFRWSVKGNSNNIQVIFNPGSTGTYRMYTGVYDGAGNLEVYENKTSKGTASGSVSGNLYSYWNIGQREDFNRRADGKVDDARVYDKALTATEVANLHDTGSISG